MKDKIEAAQLTRWLHTEALGRAAQCFDTVDSTNRVIKSWAAEGAPHGAVAVADVQTAGRGRKGRTWESAGGEGLWMSLLLRPKVTPEQVQSVTLLMAVAVAQAVETCCPTIRPKIKWPNDLLVHDRKLCGILTELTATMAGIDSVVVGIGVNCHHTHFPEPLDATATSLYLCGAKVDRTQLCAEILNHAEPLLRAWEAGSFSAIADAYRPRMAFMNERVMLTLPTERFEGVVCGVNDEGHLLLRDDAGAIHPVFSGEVTVRRAEHAQ